jgi:hypothetical protein
MMADETRELESDVPDLPPRLVEDLISIYDLPVTVPVRVNQSILNQARAQLSRRPSRRALRWVGAAAAAACVIFGARIALQGPGLPNDIDGNRRVDIVDALKLAHQIQAGRGRDANHDGVIDQADVDSIAMAVVQLNGGIQ